MIEVTLFCSCAELISYILSLWPTSSSVGWGRQDETNDCHSASAGIAWYWSPCICFACCSTVRNRLGRNSIKFHHFDYLTAKPVCVYTNNCFILPWFFSLVTPLPSTQTFPVLLPLQLNAERYKTHAKPGCSLALLFHERSIFRLLQHFFQTSSEGKTLAHNLKRLLASKQSIRNIFRQW